MPWKPMTPTAAIKMSPERQKEVIRTIRKHRPKMSEGEILAGIFKARDTPLWKNDKYQAALHSVNISIPDIGEMQHLSIKRLDKEPIHDWRDMQQIKNDIMGPEREAVELYPAESRHVDCANQFHLWIFPEG